MLHYPSQMELYGPLVNSWTMRHEAKLSFIKRASRRGNFKNIAKTVAKKHQLWLCYQFQCEGHLIYYPQLESNPKLTQAPFSSEPEHVQDELRNFVPHIRPESIVEHPKWLTLQSSVYRCGVFVLLKYDKI